MKVLKPFTTRVRRIAVGDPITETDDLIPHTVESLVAGEFVEASEKPDAEVKRRKA